MDRHCGIEKWGRGDRGHSPTERQDAAPKQGHGEQHDGRVSFGKRRSLSSPQNDFATGFRLAVSGTLISLPTMHLLLRLLPLALLTMVHGDELRLNQIQAIGSHNSYHVAPPAELLGTLKKFNKGADAWNYTHPPLATQLELGVRQFELDVFADSKGGLFSNPLGLKLAGLSGAKGLKADPALSQPGIKVLHIPDADCWSTVPTLKQALTEMSAWSQQHPHHLPVMILLECKDQPQPPLPTKPEAFTRECLLEMEKEILSVIPAARILRPDDVRGKEATLRDAVLKNGWPAVDSLRGKFLFCLDNTDAIRDRYLEGNTALENRLIFASAPDAKHPAAGWFKRNDPVRDLDGIRELVEAGFLVRTRADESKPDPLMKAKAFDSGAQWVSTDHFAGKNDTLVSFGEASMVRGNPLTGGGGVAVAH